MRRWPPELDRAELHNLVLCARHPRVAVHVMLMGFVMVLRSLMFRGGPSRIWYPRGVWRRVKALGDVRAPVPQEAARWACPDWPVDGPRRLKLAVGYLALGDTPNWAQAFDDGEQYVSLHRWNWLLRACTDEVEPPDIQWGVVLMRSYLQAMTPLPQGLASESYTVGERISNSLLYARVAGGDWRCLPDDIGSALNEMAHHLARHLEYHGSHATGNHPLNNARALYLAGQCLGQPGLSALGLAVMAERLAVVQTPDGFMREGSSHYHLLFTRWLLEVQFAAHEFGDAQALALLAEPVKAALACCWFFLVRDSHGQWTVPTIGDVSPDAEPAWLQDLGHSVPAARTGTPADMPPPGRVAGWAGLWSGVMRGGPGSTQGAVLQDLSEDGFRSFPGSGWHRLQWHGWTALWRTEAGGMAVEASHAHQDLCSLVLFRHGHEILIDIGRPDYERDSLAGMKSVTHGAHNSLTIDGLGPMLTQRDRFFPRRYRRGAVEIKTVQEGDCFQLTLTHDGFKRLARGPVRHARHFSFSPRGVVIEDTLDGVGQHQVVWHFQWASRNVSPHPAAEPVLGRGGIQMQTSGLHDGQSVCVEADPSGLAGWRYPSYGVRQPCVTQRVHGVITLPAVVRHAFSVQDEVL